MSPLNRIYREVDAAASRSDRAEGPARAALLSGVILSGVLLVCGCLLVLLRREPRPDVPPAAASMLRGLFTLQGVSWLYLGLLVLAATPILRVGIMLGVYLHRREWFMVGVSLTVLLLLVVGLILGTG